MSGVTPLAGKVCIVTGATRGIGKGIALQLGQAGATVYITGRTLTKEDCKIPVGGSLTDTAKEIQACGGKCIPVQCDHSKDADIKRLFEQVKQEQDGQLDVLVNNAYSAVRAIADNYKTPFWEQDPGLWDEINNVGLRNHYRCSVEAAKLMVPRAKGLIVNVSSIGGLCYLFNIPYGIGKEACDRMAADCSLELKKYNVAFVSLWPGAVLTENVAYMLNDDSAFGTEKERANVKKGFQNGESTEYAGKCVAALAADPKIMQKSGRILLSADLGDEYGFEDINGQKPMNVRRVNSLLRFQGLRWLSWLFPDFIKIPCWCLSLLGNKFSSPKKLPM